MADADIVLHPQTERDIGIGFQLQLAPGVSLTGTPSVEAGPIDITNVRINSETFYDADSVHSIPEDEGVIFYVARGDAVLNREYEITAGCATTDGGFLYASKTIVFRK